MARERRTSGRAVHRHSGDEGGSTPWSTRGYGFGSTRERAAAGKDGDEAPAGAIDMVHVLARAQLGVRNVEEVGATRDGAERIPGLDVGAGIVGVTVAATKGDGDPAVVCRREDKEELLEIGAVVLGDTIGDRRRGSTADLAAPSPAIGAAEAHGSTIVVQLVKLQGKSLADRQDHIGEQRRTIGIEQVVECTPDPVIPEVLHLLGRDAEHTGGEAIHGLLLAIDRLSFDDDRAQQHSQRTGVRDEGALIGGHVAGERIV